VSRATKCRNPLLPAPEFKRYQQKPRLKSADLHTLDSLIVYINRSLYPFSMASPKSSPTFIQLLPAKTYVRPEIEVKSHAFNADLGLPTADEIQEAMLKRRSSSASTASNVASSNEGERRHFLPLATSTLVEESGEL